MKEIWDLYDSDGELTGETMLRGAQVPPGRFHLIVHIWLISPDGSMLIQQRNKPGKVSHEKWAPTAGSAQTGQSSLETAIRETGEEIGLLLSADQLILHERQFIQNFIQDVWLCEWDGQLSTLRADPEEVLQLKKVSWSEMMEMLHKGDFINYGDAFFERLYSKVKNTILSVREG